MIDYCNIQYVDDMITDTGGGGSDRLEFVDYYPSTLSLGGLGDPYITFSVELSYLYTLSAYSVYWFYIKDYLPENWETSFPSDYHLFGVRHSNAPDRVGACFYYRTSLSGVYYRFDTYYDLNIPNLPEEDIDYYPNDIYFLYDIGKSLVENNPVSKLLGKSIGGVSLVVLLFGGAFTTYVVWVVVKWIIP